MTTRHYWITQNEVWYTQDGRECWYMTCRHETRAREVMNELNSKPRP